MKVIDIRLKCTEGSSNKYWYGQVIRSSVPGEKTSYVFNTHYGRIGATGQETAKAATTVFNAFSMLLTKLKEKVKKGYVFQTDSALISKSERERAEKDLEVAISRFLVSAQSLPGWVAPPEAPTTPIKGAGIAGKSEHPKMKESSPAHAAPKVFRKAMVTI